MNNITQYISLIILTVFLVISSCAQKEPQDTNITENASPSKYTDSLVIEYPGVDSFSVFEILQNNYQVEYKSSVMGNFVTAINSTESNSEVFWIYTVNDSIPKVACDKFITKKGDKVKWHFRKFKK